jgi:hypothetical protein
MQDIQLEDETDYVTPISSPSLLGGSFFGLWWVEWVI